jgi:hypothetical protein
MSIRWRWIPSNRCQSGSPRVRGWCLPPRPASVPAPTLTIDLARSAPCAVRQVTRSSGGRPCRRPLIYGNRLSGNYNGITGTQQDRPDSTPPAHLLDSLRVRDNLTCAINGEHPTGVVADNGDNLAARSITFAGNTIQSTACT